MHRGSVLIGLVGDVHSMLKTNCAQVSNKREIKIKPRTPIGYSVAGVAAK